MKKIYSVNNSKVVLGLLSGLKSRITSTNSRLWTIMTPMLFVAFGLFGVNVEAWGVGQAKIKLYSCPSTGGYVYANTEDKNNIGTLTEDDATTGTLTSSTTTMYRYAKAKDGYEFRGWATTNNGSPSSTSTSVTVNVGTWFGTTTTEYWAIFSALPKYYFKATATTNSSTYGNAYVTFTSSSANSATTTEVTTNCYGTHYNTASMTKTAYFRAVPKTGYVFKGWSTDNTEANIFNTNASITYNLTSSSKNSASPASIRYYAIFGEKFAPQINGTASVNKEVGDSYTADFSFVNTSLTTPSSSSTADFYYTITHELSTSVNNGTNVISYNPSTGAIQALNAGKATITFINKSTTTHQYKEESFVINVAKKEPTFSCGTSMNVGQNLSCTYTNTSANTPTANSSDNFYYVFTNNTPSGITTGSDTPGAILTFAGNKVYGKNAGTGTITFYQKETYMYKPKNSGAINITVTKNNNELSCSWGNWIKNVNFDSHTAVTFTSTNTEAGAPAVTISKVSGGAVADYNSSTKKIDANHREGTVIWEVEQVEDYKYIRAFEKCTVNVGTVAAPDCDVLLYSSDPDNEASEVGEIDLGGVGTRVDFQMKKKGAGATATLSFYVPGSGWSSKSVSASSAFSYGAHSEDLPAGTTKIKFAKGGVIGTDDPYINTIRVMRTKYFDIENKAGSAITEMTMPLNIHGGVVKRDTFYVDYSTCEGTIKLENHHPRIKFAATNSNSYSFSTGTAHHGRPSIALTYTSPANDAENITDTIYIYTPSDHKKLIVHAQSKGKLTTTLHYIGNASYTTDATNIAATALFEVRDENNDLVANPIITLGTGTTSNVTLANDNKSIASLCGNSNDGTTGNVTASYAGDGTYEAATNNGLSQNFTINRLKDEVSFDSGYESMVVGEEIDLTEWATSCTSGSDITVTSVFTDYIVIEDGKVKAVAKGNGRLRAVSEGNCTYNSGTSYLNIKVRNADDPCESPLLYKSGLLKVGAYGADNGTTLTIKDGPQDKLTFKVWRVTAATQYARLIFLDKDNNEITHIDYDAGSLPTSEPESYNKTVNLTLPAYAGTKKIQVDGWGTLNKYFKELRVSQQTYLTASASSVTMSTVKGCETAVGQVNISYSDVSRLQFSQTNENFRYEVWEGETKLEDGFANDCGDYGTYTVKFFYEPQTVGEYSNTVTISASGLSQTITLNGTANKPDRTIMWDIPTGNTITATQSVNLTAYAKTDCEDPAGSVTYSYTSAVAGAATIEGSKITFNKAATVTVKAETVTSDMYEDATYVEKVWTVGKVSTQMRTLPTITSTITYGDNSSVVTYDNDSWKAEEVLNNTEVKGHINYVGPASFTAAGPQNLIFNFTPDSIATYDVCQFTVPVTVQHIASVATPVAANITYGQRVNESVLTSGEGSTTPGTWAWKDEAANMQVLDASADAYTGLNVIFTPDDSNYSTIETTVSLKVDKADPEATVSNVGITYGATASSVALSGTGVAGTWSWTDTRKDDVLAAGSYTMNVHFIPNDATNYNEKDVTVSLTVNKATPVATPSAAAITAGQKVNESALSNSGEEGSWEWDEAVKDLTPAAGTYQYTVHFTPDNENYTTLTTTVTLQVNAPVSEFTNAAGDGDWGNAANWTFVPTGENPDVIVSGALKIDEDVTVGSLTIESTGSIAVITGGTLTVKGMSEYRAEYGDIHVLNDGALALGNSADLQVRDFTLDAQLSDGATSAASGQVSNEEKMNVNRDVYFQLSFDPAGAVSYGWYDFTVPFAVNINGGITRIGSIDDREMVSGTDFLIMEDDEVNYAAGGKGWRTMSNSGVLVPGKLYTITFNYQATLPQNTFRFAWNKQGSITNGTSYDAEYIVSSDAARTGWNAIGNGMLCHGYVSSSYKLQAYNHTDNVYEIVYDPKTFAVGTAFFVQVLAAGDIDWTPAEATLSRPLYAPAGESKEVEEFRLSLRNEATGVANDVLFFSASEEATEAYAIGHDLLKKGTPIEAKKAQMWATKGGKTLCDVEATLTNNEANTSLSLFTPQAQTYVLSVDATPEDADLYLTYNDQVIWDLTASPYVLDLAKGTTEGYGLCIVARAPQIATGVDEANADSKSVRKVVINDKIYMITPEGKMYDIVGKSVKY